TRGVGVGGRGGDGGEEEATAVGRQPQGEVEVVGGEGLVVVGAVEPGRAVGHPAHLLDVVEVLVGFDVLAALEQHVLEEVGEAGPAWPLVLRADVIPEVDGDQGEAAVEVEDDAQPVSQGVLGEAEVGVRGGHRLLRIPGRTRRADPAQPGGTTAMRLRCSRKRGTLSGARGALARKPWYSSQPRAASRRSWLS